MLEVETCRASSVKGDRRDCAPVSCKTPMTVFPDPRYAPSDIVAMGEDLRVETLREAYRKGIFPWPHEGLPLPWFSPRRRAVIFFEELHVGRSLRKKVARAPYTFTIDRDFSVVINACAAADRPEQDGTWIAPPIIDAYSRLHAAGDAHSVEAWDADGALAGGLYGVDAGGVFTGESMFHRRPDASKLALLFLIERLRESGSTLLDCQVMTPHMEALGAREITRGRFLDILVETQARSVTLF
jgi:leucyl/phenylalanyl-tRNA---protein transferase